MVTIIKIGSSINRTINYNENKVKTGHAQCIEASNYPVDLNKLTLSIKKKRFNKITSLNQNIKRNAMHITLNFSPLEHHSKEILVAIANTYMQRIGFARQPYLIYEHYDAAHQHLHVVTTYIKNDGNRMAIYNLAFRKSEPAREQIEECFGLIKARGQKSYDKFELNSIPAKRIKYGETESKKAINIVLNYILNQYSYTNFKELNAILSQYNLTANRGRENSKTFQKRGLLYQILNKNGKPVGLPIKASDLDNQPTLTFLEEKFKSNLLKNADQQIRIKKIVDLYLLRSISLKHFTNTLLNHGIIVLKKDLSKGDEDITYIDSKTKCAISGDLPQKFIEKEKNQAIDSQLSKKKIKSNLNNKNIKVKII